jgi:hypothetical protein
LPAFPIIIGLANYLKVLGSSMTKYIHRYKDPSRVSTHYARTGKIIASKRISGISGVEIINDFSRIFSCPETTKIAPYVRLPDPEYGNLIFTVRFKPFQDNLGIFRLGVYGWIIYASLAVLDTMSDFRLAIIKPFNNAPINHRRYTAYIRVFSFINFIQPRIRPIAPSSLSLHIFLISPIYLSYRCYNKPEEAACQEKNGALF